MSHRKSLQPQAGTPLAGWAETSSTDSCGQHTTKGTNRRSGPSRYRNRAAVGHLSGSLYAGSTGYKASTSSGNGRPLARTLAAPQGSRISSHPQTSPTDRSSTHTGPSCLDDVSGVRTSQGGKSEQRDRSGFNQAPAVQLTGHTGRAETTGVERLQTSGKKTSHTTHKSIAIGSRYDSESPCHPCQALQLSQDARKGSTRRTQMHQKASQRSASADFELHDHAGISRHGDRFADLDSPWAVFEDAHRVGAIGSDESGAEGTRIIDTDFRDMQESGKTGRTREAQAPAKGRPDAPSPGPWVQSKPLSEHVAPIQSSHRWMHPTRKTTGELHPHPPVRKSSGELHPHPPVSPKPARRDGQISPHVARQRPFSMAGLVSPQQHLGNGSLEGHGGIDSQMPPEGEPLGAARDHDSSRGAGNDLDSRSQVLHTLQQSVMKSRQAAQSSTEAEGRSWAGGVGPPGPLDAVTEAMAPCRDQPYPPHESLGDFNSPPLPAHVHQLSMETAATEVSPVWVGGDISEGIHDLSEGIQQDKLETGSSVSNPYPDHDLSDSHIVGLPHSVLDVEAGAGRWESVSDEQEYTDLAQCDAAPLSATSPSGQRSLKRGMKPVGLDLGVIPPTIARRESTEDLESPSPTMAGRLGLQQGFAAPAAPQGTLLGPDGGSAQTEESKELAHQLAVHSEQTKAVARRRNITIGAPPGVSSLLQAGLSPVREESHGDSGSDSSRQQEEDSSSNDRSPREPPAAGPSSIAAASRTHDTPYVSPPSIIARPGVAKVQRSSTAGLISPVSLKHGAPKARRNTLHGRVPTWRQNAGRESGLRVATNAAQHRSDNHKPAGLRHSRSLTPGEVQLPTSLSQDGMIPDQLGAIRGHQSTGGTMAHQSKPVGAALSGPARSHPAGQQPSELDRMLREFTAGQVDSGTDGSIDDEEESEKHNPISAGGNGRDLRESQTRKSMADLGRAMFFSATQLGQDTRLVMDLFAPALLGLNSPLQLPYSLRFHSWNRPTPSIKLHPALDTYKVTLSLILCAREVAIRAKTGRQRRIFPVLACDTITQRVLIMCNCKQPEQVCQRQAKVDASSSYGQYLRLRAWLNWFQEGMQRDPREKAERLPLRPRAAPSRLFEGIAWPWSLRLETSCSTMCLWQIRAEPWRRG